MDQKLKYFVYVRKSSEGKDRQALSHEGQLMEIERLIERENLHIVDTYKESKSAHIPDNRPLFNQMLKRIKRGEADGIIAWHTNRLSRNPKESGIVQQLLQDEVIKSIIVPYRHFRSDDNALLFSIETSEANQYSRDLKVAVKRGLNQKYLLGHPPGMAPLGYLNTKFALRGSNKITVDEERWPIVREGFDMLLSQTFSVREILEVLITKHGLRTRAGNIRGGRPLSHSGIYRMFTNPFYCGIFYRNGTLYKGSYKPMLTVEEFDRIQIILGRKGKPRPKSHRFAFTGLITCGECGSAITACMKQKTLKSGELRSYILYHCTRRKNGASECTQRKYLPEPILESLIIKEMHEYEIHYLFRELGISAAKQNNQKVIDKYRGLIEAQETSEKRVKQELSNLVDLRITNDISQEIYLQKKAEKEELLIRIQSKRDSIKTMTHEWIIEIETRLNFTVDLANRFQKGDLQTKKEMCKDFGRNWTLKDQELFIDKPKWLDAIKSYKKGVESFFDPLEPEKTVKAKGLIASIETINPFLCALVDEVRTNNGREGGKPEDISP